MIFKIAKFIAGVLILAAVVYFGYVFYEKWYSSGGLNGVVSSAEEKASGTLNGAKNTVVSGLQSVLAKNASDVAKWAGDQMYSLGKSIAGTSSLSGVSSTETVGTNSIPFFNNQVIAAPSSSESSSSVPPPTVSIMTGLNQQISLSLVSDGTYEVNWGDGVVEDGTGKGLDTITVIAHSWSKAGDYPVQVKTTQAGQTSSYSFPIRVLE